MEKKENRLMQMFDDASPVKKTKKKVEPGADKKKKLQGIYLTDEEITYCKLRMKKMKAEMPEMIDGAGVSGFIRFLIENDMKVNSDIKKKAKEIFELENS